MAMKDSSSSSPDWMQIYHQSITVEIQPVPLQGHVPPATERSLPSQTISAAVSNSRNNLRVKNSSRKSRASKKSPAMVFNTDVANFRVLVQQFTGIDSVPMINHHRKYEVQHQQHQQLQPKQQGTLFNNTSDLLVQEGYYFDGMYATSDDNRNGGYSLGVDL